MRSWILGFQIKPSDFGVGCWTFLLHAVIRSVRFRYVTVFQFGRNSCAALFEKIVEMLDHRPLVDSLLEPIRSRKIGFHVFEGRFTLITEHELDFPELDRLKAGR